jgi:hypothetical protein
VQLEQPLKTFPDQIVLAVEDAGYTAHPRG